MKKSRPRSKKQKVRSHKNMAAASLVKAEFRPRQVMDETKVIPRKRKYDDELD